MPVPLPVPRGVFGRIVDIFDRNLITPAFATWRIPREEGAKALAEANRMRVLAQAEMDADAIKSGLAVLDPRTLQAARLDAGADLPLQEPMRLALASAAGRALREDINVAKTLMLVEDLLDGDTSEPPAASVDEDWLHKWRANAASVSSEQLREFWARLLIGEVKAPGSYSLRLQSFLSTMSTADAQVISTLLAFELNGAICVEDSVKPLLDAAGLTFGQMLELEDIGILVGVQSLVLNITHKTMVPGRFIQVIRAGARAIVVQATDETLSFKLATYKLTTTAQQLKTLGSIKPNEDYLREVALAIAKKDSRFEVYVTDLTHFEGNRVAWQNGVRIEVSTPSKPPPAEHV